MSLPSRPREFGDDRALHDVLELSNHDLEYLVLAILGPVIPDPAVGHMVVVVVLELVLSELQNLDDGILASVLDQRL